MVDFMGLHHLVFCTLLFSFLFLLHGFKTENYSFCRSAGIELWARPCWFLVVILLAAHGICFSHLSLPLASETLDPLLEPLLQKAKFKAGNMIMTLGTELNRTTLRVLGGLCSQLGEDPQNGWVASVA